MSYATGSAADLSALRTAIFNACTANGWTLSGEVLHRGTCYARLQVVSSSVQLLGGNGIDGGNNLTTPGPQVVRIAGDIAVPPAFPLTYHIFINTNPDEVYVVVNYSSAYFQFLSFGQSHIPTASSGNWYAASFGPSAPQSGLLAITQVTGGAASGQGYHSGAFFWTTSGVASIVNQFVAHGLDGTTWSGTTGVAVVGGIACAIQSVTRMVDMAPNANTSESPLIPVPVVIQRASSLYSIVAQPRHSRYVRVDNFVSGQVISIASDQWMVFPFFSKNDAARNGGSAITHTGTFGWAIRYTP